MSFRRNLDRFCLDYYEFRLGEGGDILQNSQYNYYVETFHKCSIEELQPRIWQTFVSGNIFNFQVSLILQDMFLYLNSETLLLLVVYILRLFPMVQFDLYKF